MSEAFWILLLCLSSAVLLLWVRQVSGRLQASRRELDGIEAGEQRMFDFLHLLGKAIEEGGSENRVHRMIVDGIGDVVGAQGGAVYLLSEDKRHLVPSYLSENCPPLVGVPLEIRRKAKRDPRALESHLRLSRVDADDGVLGHCLAVGKALHVRDLKSHPSFRDAFVSFRDEVEVLLSPLRHAGRDLGVLAVAKRRSEVGFSGNDFAVFRSLADQSGFALGNALLHIELREKRRLEAEIRNAREVQRVLLPEAEPSIRGYRVYGTNIPARIISGDYYDFLDLGDGRHGVVIADVSGKGVPAGLLMAMCRSALRSVAPGESSPARVLANVNRQLFPDIREDMFISMAYLVIDSPEGTVRLARAGHDAPLWFRKRTGKVSEVRSPGLAVGIDDGGVFERTTRDHEFEMESGDCLLLHTDGVREALDDEEREYGIERTIEVFGDAALIGAESAVDAIQRDLESFSGSAPQMDDITLIAIEKR